MTQAHADLAQWDVASPLAPKEETYEKMGGLKSEKFTPRCLKNAQAERHLLALGFVVSTQVQLYTYDRDLNFLLSNSFQKLTIRNFAPR